MINFKHLFFLLVLINAIFFLWSLRSGMVVKLEAPATSMNSGEKQILLASEVKKPKKKKRIKKRKKPKKKIIKKVKPVKKPVAVIKQPVAPAEIDIDSPSTKVATDKLQNQAVLPPPSPDAPFN